MSETELLEDENGLYQIFHSFFLFLVLYWSNSKIFIQNIQICEFCVAHMSIEIILSIGNFERVC